jgi:hypothetical protein
VDYPGLGIVANFRKIVFQLLIYLLFYTGYEKAASFFKDLTGDFDGVVFRLSLAVNDLRKSIRITAKEKQSIEVYRSLSKSIEVH